MRVVSRSTLTLTAANPCAKARFWVEAERVYHRFIARTPLPSASLELPAQTYRCVVLAWLRSIKITRFSIALFRAQEALLEPSYLKEPRSTAWNYPTLGGLSMVLSVWLRSLGLAPIVQLCKRALPSDHPGILSHCRTATLRKPPSVQILPALTLLARGYDRVDRCPKTMAI